MTILGNVKKNNDTYLFEDIEPDFSTGNTIVAAKCNDGSVYFFSNNIPEYESLVDPERAPKKQPYVMPYPVIHKPLPINGRAGMKYLFLGYPTIKGHVEFYVKVENNTPGLNKSFGAIGVNDFHETNGKRHSENSVTCVVDETNLKIFHVENVDTSEFDSCSCQLEFMNPGCYKILSKFKTTYNNKPCFDLSRLKRQDWSTVVGNSSSPFIKIVQEAYTNGHTNPHLEYDGTRVELKPKQPLTKFTSYLYKNSFVVKIRKKRRNIVRTMYYDSDGNYTTNPKSNKTKLKLRVVEDFLVCELFGSSTSNFTANITITRSNAQQVVQITNQDFSDGFASNHRICTITRRNSSGDTFYGWSVKKVVFTLGSANYHYQAIRSSKIRTHYRNMIIRKREHVPSSASSRTTNSLGQLNHKNGILARIYPVHRGVMAKKFVEIYFTNKGF